MQTFLPYSSYSRSAKVLDTKRLGKQRVEVLQILRALHGVSRGWRNHPATKMWRGYEGSLARYGCAICDEWTARGYKDNCKSQIVEFGTGGGDPWWLGNEVFHQSHQSNLNLKDPNFYSFDVPSNLEYIWPTQLWSKHGAT